MISLRSRIRPNELEVSLRNNIGYGVSEQGYIEPKAIFHADVEATANVDRALNFQDQIDFEDEADGLTTYFDAIERFRRVKILGVLRGKGKCRIE